MRPFGLTGSSAMNSAQDSSVRCGSSAMNSAQDSSVRCGSSASSWWPLPLQTVDRDQFDRRADDVAVSVAVDLDRPPVHVHQQLFGLALCVPCLCEDRLHRLRLVLLAADDLPRQRHHQVVALIPEGGEPVLGQFALDRQRALELPGHQLEGVGQPASASPR